MITFMFNSIESGLDFQRDRKSPLHGIAAGTLTGGLFGIAFKAGFTGIVYGSLFGVLGGCSYAGIQQIRLKLQQINRDDMGKND